MLQFKIIILLTSTKIYFELNVGLIQLIIILLGFQINNLRQQYFQNLHLSSPLKC